MFSYNPLILLGIPRIRQHALEGVIALMLLQASPAIVLSPCLNVQLGYALTVVTG